MGNKVYFIGAGPGNPDLITVRGINILRQADVVIYDYLVDKRILKETKKDAELICCDTLGKNRYPDGFLVDNDKINRVVIKKTKEGKRVVRLKNGDVSIFSRLSQELEALVREKVEFEIVPGVTAASAASALSGIPLTDRRFASSCVFVTGHEDLQKQNSSVDWVAAAKMGTLVLYMAVGNIGQIAKILIRCGKDSSTPVAVIQQASTLSQRIVTGTLTDIGHKIKREDITPPAIIIIGEVVRLEKRFNWFKKAKKILFTGISAERFFERGLIFHLPMVEIRPLEDYTELDNWIKNMYTYSCLKEKGALFDWIVFLSRYGVHYFFERLFKLGYDTRMLKDIKIAAIGDSTRRRLLEAGIIADVVPGQESSKGLLEELRKIGIKDKRIFIPRSDIADKAMAEGLKELGADVVSSFAYRNVMPQDLPDLDFAFFEEIIFTSPSGVRNFLRRYAKPPKAIKISCIGQVTEDEARRWNLID